MGYKIQRQLLRRIAWAVAVLAIIDALNGSTAPGGPGTGLILGTTLIIVLKQTSKPKKKGRK